MEAIISNMLTRFEKGSLSRRDLISGLSMLAAGAASAEAAQNSGLKGLTIDHISIQVSDLQKSIAFYQNVFGLSIMSEDKPNQIVRMGTRKKQRVSINRSSNWIRLSTTHRCRSVRITMSSA